MCVPGTETVGPSAAKRNVGNSPQSSPHDQRRTGRLACISFTVRSTRARVIKDRIDGLIPAPREISDSILGHNCRFGQERVSGEDIHT